MSRLPLELVFSILEHIYYTLDGSTDYTSLVSCSLVCTSWSGPAQSLLFRRTVLSRSHKIPSLLFALTASASHGRLIGHAVRCLEITVGQGLNQMCLPEAFAQLLEACPRLYELTISIYGLHQFDQFLLSRLKNAGQSIRALNLQTCGVQSPVLFQLLVVWKHVRFLKIGTEIAAWPWRHPSRTPGLHLPRSEPGDIPQRPLAPVLLYDLELSRIPQPAVLAWLLGSSALSLRILDLREVPGIPARETLAIHAPHLRSLRLLHFNLHSVAFLRLCTQLEEFVIYNIPVVVPLAPELPPSIEHLSFRNPTYAAHNTLRPILDAIDVLPKLRIVTCDTNSQALHQFSMLKAKCTKRSIEVVITQVPFWVVGNISTGNRLAHYCPHQPEDPVNVHRFPRQRSVTNFSLMTS